MPDSPSPPTAEDIDARVKALEEYLQANPSSAPGPATPHAADHTGGMVIHTTHFTFHFTFRQIAVIAAGTLILVGIGLLLARLCRKSAP